MYSTFRLMLKYAIILVLLASAAASAEEPAQKANQFLESLPAVIAVTPPDFQSGALLQLANVELGAGRRAAALDHLNQAFAASAALPSERDYRIREEIQALIAAVTARINPERAAEMIAVIAPASGWEKDQRAVAVEQIVRPLLSAKKTDEAFAAFDRYAPEALFPFQPAGDLLKLLAPEDQRRATLCAQALAAFRQRPDVENFNIYLRNYRKEIPPQLFETSVRALVQSALDRKGLPRPLLFSITTPKGTVAVRDSLDSVLFQMYDLAFDIDPDLAKRIADGRPELQQILQRYPRGQASLQADGDAVTTWTDAESKDGKPTPAQQQRSAVVAMEGLKVQQAMTVLRTDPGKYLEIVREIPTPRLKTRMYSTYAMFAASRPPEEGKPMLAKCVTELEEVKDPSASSSAWVTVANAAHRLKDAELAARALDRAIADAAAQLKADADQDNPNLAPKCLWPSATAVRTAFYRAAEVLGPNAESLLERIPDNELQSMARIEMAAQWLGVPFDQPVTKIRRKTAN